jgi:RNA polymerase sigma-70 factor (ECF subfamily)
VSRTLGAWFRQGAKIPGAELREVEVNGEAGAVILDGEGRIISVMALDIAGGRVQGIRSIVNPDKLRHLGPVADVAALLKGVRPP